MKRRSVKADEGIHDQKGYEEKDGVRVWGTGNLISSVSISAIRNDDMMQYPLSFVARFVSSVSLNYLSITRLMRYLDWCYNILGHRIDPSWVLCMKFHDE